MVTSFQTISNSDLILPLSSSDFGIDSGDFHSGIETFSKMGLSDLSSESILISHGAIILSLWFGVASLWESQWPRTQSAVSHGNEVLLLDSEPGVFVLAILEDFTG